MDISQIIVILIFFFLQSHDISVRDYVFSDFVTLVPESPLIRATIQRENVLWTAIPTVDSSHIFKTKCVNDCVSRNGCRINITKPNQIILILIFLEDNIKYCLLRRVIPRSSDFYLMKLKYAIFSNTKVMKIERSAFFGGRYMSSLYVHLPMMKSRMPTSIRSNKNRFPVFAGFFSYEKKIIYSITTIIIVIIRLKYQLGLLQFRGNQIPDFFFSYDAKLNNKAVMDHWN